MTTALAAGRECPSALRRPAGSLFRRAPAWPVRPRLGARRSLQVLARQGQPGGDEAEFGVFRFTLGIPGFDDRLVPRVVGAGGGALLLLNHLLTTAPAPPAQGRAEAVGAVLAVLLALVPWLEARLRDVLYAQGRRASSAQLPGTSNAFLMAADVRSKQQTLATELAWCSASLLRNVNTCAVAVDWRGQLLLARGALAEGAARSDAQDALRAAEQELSSTSEAWLRVRNGTTQRLVLADRSALSGAALLGTTLVPRVMASAALAHIAGGGVLLATCDQPRGFTDKDLRWLEALASKLSLRLNQQE